MCWSCTILLQCLYILFYYIVYIIIIITILKYCLIITYTGHVLLISFIMPLPLHKNKNKNKKPSYRQGAGLHANRLRGVSHGRNRHLLPKRFFGVCRAWLYYCNRNIGSFMLWPYRNKKASGPFPVHIFIPHTQTHNTYKYIHFVFRKLDWTCIRLQDYFEINIRWLREGNTPRIQYCLNPYIDNQ